MILLPSDSEREKLVCSHNHQSLLIQSNHIIRTTRILSNRGELKTLIISRFAIICKICYHHISIVRVHNKIMADITSMQVRHDLPRPRLHTLNDCHSGTFAQFAINIHGHSLAYLHCSKNLIERNEEGNSRSPSLQVTICFQFPTSFL